MKNKIGNILLSLAVAFGLWLYVITVVSPGSTQTYYNIPVVIEGEPVLNDDRGLMITSTSTSTITVTLSGNRTDLSKVDNKNITVKADVSKIYEPGSQIEVVPTISFPGNVPNNAFVIETKSPQKLYFTVERRLSKDVPVEVRWIGSAPEGFMTDRENRVLDYPLINVTGPQSVVNQIEKAIIDVDLNEQRESISADYHYTLCNAEDEPVDAELIVTNVEEVRLDVKIERVKDLMLAVSVTEGGGAKEANAEVTLNVDTIRVSGSEAVLEMLGDTLIIGNINLAEVTKNTVIAFAVPLPEGVTNRTGVTEVEAAVKLNGLATKDFVIYRIESIHVPEGLDVELITEKLDLQVRGPAAQIARLMATDLTVQVDFTGAEIGTSTFRAVVSFPEGFEDVGTLRIDSVSAAVTAAK